MGAMNDAKRLSANKSIAAELRALRARLKITQSELADRLGVTSGTISKWENGLVPLTVDCLQRYATIFATSVVDIIRDAGLDEAA